MATPAQAGTNGQQVAVSTWHSDKARVCGYNQNHTYACTPWFSTPGSGWYGVAGYWFKGDVFITGVNAVTGAARHVTCNIPKSQSGDWTLCDGRRHRDL
ncbi:hypothetical protein [Streptomyces sp. NPDC001851]|uniref:hypothetical protein n=1 Tax=Streptomyces sp. NPDC001851 TaxID=3154529 RepID=UPI0033270B3F